MRKRIILSALTSLLTTINVQAQTINTIAGNGTGLDGSPAISASLSQPYNITFDHTGNLYIADYLHNRVRKVSALTGIITTVAGNGTAGFSGDGGPATNAELFLPSGVILDTAGNVYIADYGNNRIRKVTESTGVITTFAGNSIVGNCNGTPGCFDGPLAISIDKHADVYVADKNNNAIRKINHLTGYVSRLTGYSMGFSGDGGPASSAALHSPCGVFVDTADNIFIVDENNSRIRKITSLTGLITTVAGGGVGGDGSPATAANIGYPIGVIVDSVGNIYIGNTNNIIKKISSTTTLMSTFAGTVGGFSGDGGPATACKLSYPTGFGIFDGNIFIADQNNNRIREICMSNVSPAILVSTSHDTVCSGTSVTYTSSITGGGTSPTYQWQVNGINVGTGSTFSYTPLNGDVVKCILTSNATCSFPDTAVSSTITMVVNPVVTPSISISASATNVCTGTSVSFISTITGGGTSPAYQWKVDGVSMGTGSSYSYVPSNGDIIICTLTSSAACATPGTVTSVSITMTVSPVVVPTISISTPATTICAGTIETFVSSISNGGTGPLYQWKVNGLNVGTASNYSYLPLNGDNINCSLTSNATCATPATVISSSVSMIVNSIPTTYSVTGSGTYFDTGIITLSNSQVGVTYQLSNGSSAYGLPVAGSGSVLTFYVTTSGTYSIVATETLGGCTDTMASSANMIINPSIVPNLNEPSRARIYPNPANDKLNIEDPQLYEIQIIDVTGRVLINKSCYPAKFTIDIASLKSGLYLVKLNGQYVQKFVKE